jgi:phosphohistidine phosphatase
MQLFFLRHGLADRSAWHGNDFKRPLTPKGRSRMQREALQLDRIGLQVDYILSSPLIRAVQTAEIVASVLKRTDRLVLDDRLKPCFDMAKLQALLTDYADAQKLMLVGHEPDFSTVIGQVIGEGDVVCKKGSLARIDLDSCHPLHGELVWLLPPRILIR